MAIRCSDPRALGTWQVRRTPASKCQLLKGNSLVRGRTQEGEEDVTGSRQPFLCMHRKACSDPEPREGAARQNLQGAGKTSALFLEKRRQVLVSRYPADRAPRALEGHMAFLLLLGVSQTSLKTRARLFQQSVEMSPLTGSAMGWDGMGWDGMGWTGLGWTGLGWDG